MFNIAYNSILRKIATAAAVLAAAVILMCISPADVQAAQAEISSDDEGMAYISQAFLSMDDELYLTFSPYEVDVNLLVFYLRMITPREGGIYVYSQMEYNGYSCTYSASMLQIDFEWKLTGDQEQIYDATVEMLAPYLIGATDYDTIKNVHDWICLTTEYDYDTLYGFADRHTGYNALFEHLAVCDGYATLFQKFMDKLGIPCYCMTGDNHAWNIVCYGGTWYRVDCTWDDQSSGIIYKYFMY